MTPEERRELRERRERIATAILSGIFASPKHGAIENPAFYAQRAAVAADALIAVLDDRARDDRSRRTA